MLDAMIDAGNVRIRPIIMTTLCTLLGLIPMAFSTGEGSEIRAPLAITEAPAPVLRLAYAVAALHAGKCLTRLCERWQPKPGRSSRLGSGLQ